ncbi:similar to Saccharomyces cerevisiae YER128W Protein that interacts with Vps4p and has a role in vacuolar sorting [Maudiozyma barnettii]|uniref:Similar to Saccharomyces cerevisiae YER128W Protein that interacts with Vps4p and has a role in vacuolar sorting n=1 Tax=Maudiozyma barnettii TaxID=61262 RepID=A0A8H2VEY7_9SACH|nr:Vfa1p [Kazachstania barnettii]CAB4254351.1 similar to Saccharomyces cerevisiae YER128W Protein that interacts with Vps4p and has a role in vacuolar sorting [Kazachstania barnettii]CAD1782213.1 similar to Saccharomyces cerevisiae YER128W Protein that interacts with Vps4p and has a role in vacuolar sorting [Kazachstania barnettii]
MSNEYVKRKVALKDMNPCMICSKPATTVLFNQTLKDLIYTCDIHLIENPGFVVPIHSQEYNSTVAELQRVKLQLKVQASNGSGSWDTWVNKIFTKRNSSKDSENSDDTKKDETPTPVKEDQDKLPAIDYQSEYNKLLDKMTELQMKVRNFKLNDNMFQHRLQTKKAQQIAIAKRKKEEANYSNTKPEELEKVFSFPTVPSNDPNKKGQ